MTFTTTRTDIKALKFDFPLLDDAGSAIYQTLFKSSFFDLNNGDEYPCGSNQAGVVNSGRQKCFIYFGSISFLGEPVKIIMTDFNQGTQINARLLFKNPSISGTFVSISVKAFTGV